MSASSATWPEPEPCTSSFLTRCSSSTKSSQISGAEREIRSTFLVFPRMVATLGAPYFSLVSDWAAPGVLRLQGWDRGIIHGQIFLNIPLGLWKTWGSARKAGKRGFINSAGQSSRGFQPFEAPKCPSPSTRRDLGTGNGAGMWSWP